ncbi:MAG: hypothetical protein ACKOQ4_16530 [Mycobacterium sp.]
MADRRSLISVAAGALALLVAAVPAQADPAPMNGDYRVRVDGSDFGVWTFTPECTTAAGGCTATVEARAKGWSAVATLSEGRWTLTRTSETLFGCGDGSSSAGEMRAKWDAGTLTGSLLMVPDGKRCGGSSAPLRGALELLKT